MKKIAIVTGANTGLGFSMVKKLCGLLAVCPGLMDTEASLPWFKDMSKAKLPDDAADDLVWLISQKEWDQERYGALVQYKKVIPWDKK
jgi:hypothetical protein